MKHSIMRRVRRLETLIPPIPPPKPETEEDREFRETLVTLLQRMDPAQAGVVIDDCKAADRDSGVPYSRLSIAVFQRVLLHLKKHQPLELPAKVAVLEVSNEGWKTYNCEDCGYELPSNWPRLDPNSPISSKFHFEPCPLCGGKVGWHAFYTKNKCYREQLPISWEQTSRTQMEGQL